MAEYAWRYRLINVSGRPVPVRRAVRTIRQLVGAKRRGLSVALQQIDVSSVEPLCRFVTSRRLETARQLFRMCNMLNVPFGTPLEILFEDGTVQFVAPPVVEARSGAYVLCDGMHRLFIARRENVSTIVVTILRNVTIPLPGRILSWADVKERTREQPVQRNFADFKTHFLTWYTRVFNSRVVFATNRNAHETQFISLADSDL